MVINTHNVPKGGQVKRGNGGARYAARGYSEGEVTDVRSSKEGVADLPVRFRENKLRQLEMEFGRPLS